VLCPIDFSEPSKIALQLALSIAEEGTVDRLIRLDAVISHPELHWLGGEDEKVAFFGLLAPSCPSEGLPHTGSPVADSWGVRLFPDDLPMGITSTGMVVFFIALPMSDGDFRAVLQRHAALLQALPGWTVRLVFPRDGAGRASCALGCCRRKWTEREPGSGPTTNCKLLASPAISSRMFAPNFPGVIAHCFAVSPVPDFPGAPGRVKGPLRRCAPSTRPRAPIHSAITGAIGSVQTNEWHS
jgi:hypothetical protein